MEKTTYQNAGVDPEKAAAIIGRFQQFAKTKPKDPNIVTGIGPFAACYSLKELLKGYEDPLLVSCCDGVGTKAKLALEWKGWQTLGEDLVAMNTNDLLCTGAKPLLFLDYYACGHLTEGLLMDLLKSIHHGCELADCSLVGGETAEMPGVYSNDDFDLAGFSVGMVDRKFLLGSHRVKPGDVILAVESSGFHSNGYSLVRKIVDKHGAGEFKDKLLKPTLIYEKYIRPVVGQLHAIAHITGGGLYENLPRVLPANMRAEIDATSWEIPPMFRWFQEKAGISDRELLSTFNCGVGLILVCPKAEAEKVQKTVNDNKLRCWAIGKISEHDSAEPAVLWNEN